LFNIFEKRKLSSILFKREQTKEAGGAVLTKRKTGNSFSVTGLLCFMIFEKRKLSSILIKKERTKEASGAVLTKRKTGNPFSVTGLLCFMFFEKRKLSSLASSVLCFLKKGNCRASFSKRPEQRRPVALF